MERAEDGTVLPYSGRTVHCNEQHANFWHDLYASSNRTARVGLRRASLAKPAGLAVATDCSGNMGWAYNDIFVR